LLPSNVAVHYIRNVIALPKKHGKPTVMPRRFELPYLLGKP